MTHRWSRRDLLAAAGASLAGLTLGAACGGGGGAGDAARADASRVDADLARFGGFRMSIQAWTFRAFALEPMLAMVRDLGLARVELYDVFWSVSSTPEQIAAMQARLAGLGLDCVTHGTNPFSADHEANRRVFAFAQAAGITNLLADPPPEALDSLEALAIEYDRRVAIHNHGPASRYSLVSDVAAALAGRDPRIGTTVDTGHYIRSGEDPVAALRTLGDRLYGVHLKDVAAARADAPDVIIGTSGLLDLVAVFRALREVDFPADASLSLEYEANPEDPFADLVVCLDNASAAANAG